VAERYGVEELADLGGVNRRTVRYYVQEGLLPAPLGLGRGKHYGPEHLARLLEVKGLQEQGLPLDQIRRRLAGGPRRGPEPAPSGPIARTPWTRLVLLPGVELHVSGDVRIPPPSRVEELAEWCRRHFRRMEEEDDGDR
jgi:DNA-binding transcriptional MerR regulator